MAPALQRLAESLGFRLLVPLAATTALALAAHAFLGYWSIREQASRFVRADLERSAALIASATHDGMLLNRMDEVQTRIERLGSSPGFTAIRIYAKDGRITLSADPAERGTLVAMGAEVCALCYLGGQLTGAGVLDRRSMVNRDNGYETQRRLAVIPNEPSCSTAGCHAPPSEAPVLGVLDVQMSMASFDEAIAQARHQSVFTASVLILASGLAAALYIRRLVHEPIARLHEGTRRIAAGDLDTRIQVSGGHELAVLADAFNGMAAELRAARDELDRWSKTLEEKVHQKTTELRQAQQQMIRVETMASLGKLSATVVHELNNPLSGILAYTRLVRRELSEGPPDDAARKELDGYLALVDKECARCGGIVKNLLVFARGSGMQLATTDINQIVERGLMLVRHHLEIHRIQLQTAPLAGDSTIVADQGQIHQAILALLMNAIEAMQAAHGRTPVLGVHLAGDDQRVSISISDTGVGIPPDLIPHIFEPFVTTKGQTSGVGLGLSVVYGVVHGHNGEIAVQSEPGLGTTFTITLPRRRAAGAGENGPGAGPAEVGP